MPGQVVQPVASRYTDCVIPAPHGDEIYIQNLIRNIRREITSDTKTAEKDNIEMDLMEVRYENTVTILWVS
jgi:hypothetical protein